jgi:high-affinity iron transporter
VIAALAAFLIKTGRGDGRCYLHMGTVSAMVLGALIGGESRELTEGVAALFAFMAFMLFYVGFWLHSKTGAAQWKGFIQGGSERP